VTFDPERINPPDTIPRPGAPRIAGTAGQSTLVYMLDRGIDARATTLAGGIGTVDGTGQDFLFRAMLNFSDIHAPTPAELADVRASITSNAQALGGGFSASDLRASAFTVVPEPPTLALGLAGAGLLAGWGWRRRRRESNPVSPPNRRSVYH
jgi:hypothetical protein